MLLCGNCSDASVQDVLNRVDDTVRRVQGFAMAPFNSIYRILGTTDKNSASEMNGKTHITTQSNDGSEVIAIIRKQQPYSVGLVPHLNPAIQFSKGPIIAVPPESTYIYETPNLRSEYPAPCSYCETNSYPSSSFPSSPPASPETQDDCSSGAFQRLLKRVRRQVALGVVGALATPVAIRLTKKFAGRVTSKLRERLSSGSTCGNANGQQDGGFDMETEADGGGLFSGGGGGGAIGRISKLLGGQSGAADMESSSGLAERLTGKMTERVIGKITGGSGSSSGSGIGLSVTGSLGGGSSGGFVGEVTKRVTGILGFGGSDAPAESTGGGPLGFLGGLLG